mmetsp:Transcript_9122/g.21433  ORF Transcript_9122/g.21433 Transcript_9122/m.21433 type:complete len:228 (+) Transcript_9122:1384-2067(+)
MLLFNAVSRDSILANVSLRRVSTSPLTSTLSSSLLSTMKVPSASTRLNVSTRRLPTSLRSSSRTDSEVESIFKVTSEKPSDSNFRSVSVCNFSISARRFVLNPSTVESILPARLEERPCVALPTAASTLSAILFSASFRYRFISFLARVISALMASSFPPIAPSASFRRVSISPFTASSFAETASRMPLEVTSIFLEISMEFLVAANTASALSMATSSFPFAASAAS